MPLLVLLNLLVCARLLCSVELDLLLETLIRILVLCFEFNFLYLRVILQHLTEALLRAITPRFQLIYI